MTNTIKVEGGEAKVLPSGSIECPHCLWGFAQSVINDHIIEKHPNRTRLELDAKIRGDEHDLKAMAKKESKPVLAVVMEGGMISAIICTGFYGATNNPMSDQLNKFFDVITIDYDVDGADADRLCKVKQGDGSEADAFCSRWTVDGAGIDISDVIAQLEAKGE